MASKYWLKLFHETIYDPKIMMRSPGARLRWYECLCLAGDYDKDGELPPIEHMLYAFRITEKQLQDELQELCDNGLFICDGGIYSIKNWHDRQSAMDTNERSLRYRETKQKREYYEPVTKVQQECNDNATVRDADIDIDIDKINKDISETNSDKPEPTLEPCDMDGIPDSWKDKPKPSKKKERENVHPAIKAYRATTGRYPKKELNPEIIALVGDTPDLKFMMACYVAWCKVSTNSSPYKWLFEWYKNGEIKLDNSKKGIAIPEKKIYTDPYGNKVEA